MSLPERFAISGRVSEQEDCVDIEMRSPTEKHTIASDVDERFAPLFLAAPDLLAACEAMIQYLYDHSRGNRETPIVPEPASVKQAHAAIAKARGLSAN